MKNLSLKQLRYFHALVQHQHFGAAAAASAVSQPALSAQIKELETIFGGALIDRGARHFQLTMLGEALAARAANILDDVDALQDLARMAGAPFAGTLRLGIIPTIAPYLLAPLLSGLSAHYPQLDIRPNEGMTRQLLDDIHHARLDAALLALPIDAAGLQQYHLFSEEFFLVRPAAMARQPIPNLESLQQMRLLLLKDGHCLRDQTIALCQLGTNNLRNIIEANNLATLVQMVRAGLGVTLLPKMAVPHETAGGGVLASRLPSPRPSRDIGLIWRSKSPMADSLAIIAKVLAKFLSPQRREQHPHIIPAISR